MICTCNSKDPISFSVKVQNEILAIYGKTSSSHGDSGIDAAFSGQLPEKAQNVFISRIDALSEFDKWKLGAMLDKLLSPEMTPRIVVSNHAFDDERFEGVLPY